MPYILLCLDKPGHGATRQANRQAHLDYVAQTGAVAQAGPLLDASGEMEGSLLILDVADRAAAEAWAEADPYAKAGLFDRVEIRAWKKTIG